ncbi:MAG: hypothetical protein QOH79_3027 [Acidimicrobiaceae bacterium]
MQGLCLVVVVLGLAACGGHAPTKSDQGRSIAEQAGLAPEVAAFFALAASGTTATYRATIETLDAKGQPSQVTATQRPPDTRVDVFHADGTVDSTIAVGTHRYQCTMAANHWDCGELGISPSTGPQVFDPMAVQRAIDSFRQRSSDYDFRVEDRQIVGVAARCLITTRKPGHEEDSSLGAAATLCISPQGAVLSVEAPTGTITAKAYTTTIPDDAFVLPAPVVPPGSSAPTTAN